MVAKGDVRPALWPKTPCCAGPCPKARVLPKQRRLLQPGHAGHTASSERCRHVAGFRPGFAAPSTLPGKFLINKCPSTNPFSIHPVSSQNNPSDFAFAGGQGPAHRKIPSGCKPLRCAWCSLGS